MADVDVTKLKSRVVEVVHFNVDRERRTTIRNILQDILMAVFPTPFTGQVIIHLKDGGIIGLESHKSVDIKAGDDS